MISIIVAMALNRTIGKDNKLPWHIPEDLKRFKEITMGHPILMGRKTFESIGKPLPGRENIVLTRNGKYKQEGVTVIHQIDQALALTQDKELFVIGGQEIYFKFLSRADRLYLTLINQEFEGDAFFPAIDWTQFEVIHESENLISEKSGLPYRFITAQRKK